ncbi:hypothetical protein [Pararhizobium haloflavum]|uniref:hypothetical protein n=1 Tax=Pararhizobium haloflavum TaxID=2037914 RepID=UPI000C183FED|nr:hypothetical protein [Pararhizobium haloflavum]
MSAQNTERDEDAPDPGINKAPEDNEDFKPSKPIGLSEMSDLILGEGLRRRFTTRAIEREFGNPPSEKQLREIEVLLACSKFLDRLAPVLPEIKKLLTQKPKKKD